MATAYESSGRTAQKQRTRDHLVATVRRLIAEGVTPTVDQVAREARVSRTTTYRYFPSQQALLLAAHPETDRTSLLGPDAPGDPRARLELVLDEHFRILLDWEPQLRASLRASLEPGSEQPPLRGGRAIGWIRDALAPLGTRRARSLAVAIRAVAGIEPYVWLRDIAGQSPARAVAHHALERARRLRPVGVVGVLRTAPGWDDARVATEDPLVHARTACAERRWADARAAFADSDRPGALTAADLEAWGLAALLSGYDEQSDAVRERAHHAYLDAGDPHGAARTAFWLGLTLLMRGEPARAQGWLARPRSVLGDESFERTVWRGYECLNHGMRALMTGAHEESRALLAEAVAIARRHHDADLELLARNGHGQALLALGRTADGLAELDEVMVLATTGAANPQAVGQVYCAAILVCRGCLDLARSGEWTEALSRWCESQPGLVHYRGQCAVHRSEVLQLQGRWDAATDEVARVLEQGAGRTDAALGLAHYQRGELHRMCGESRAAEQAYRDALATGHDPQPGLALLRTAQGRADIALVALRRALAESPVGFVRTRLLPAYVEVALAAGDLPQAWEGLAELHGRGRAARLAVPRRRPRPLRRRGGPGRGRAGGGPPRAADRAAGMGERGCAVRRGAVPRAGCPGMPAAGRRRNRCPGG